MKKYSQKKLVLLLMCLGLLVSMTACANKHTSSNDENPPKKEEGEKQETIVDNDVGEAEPSKDFIEFDESQGYQVGEKISISSGTGDYELVIDSVSYIEPSNEYAEKPKKVILIDYTYTNYSDDLLLIDEMCFQLTNEGQEVYAPYYFDGKVTADVAESEKSVSAQLAFAQNDDETSLRLVYKDVADASFEPVSIAIPEIAEEK